MSACQEALGEIIAGRSKVPREHLAAVRVYLERRLRDAGAMIPRSGFEHLGGRAAQRHLEEGMTACMVAERFEALQVMDRYFDAVEELTEQRFRAAASADRLNQGAVPPHETPTSNAAWSGANLGSNPSKVAAAHAFVDQYVQGYLGHHFADNQGRIGAASMQACTRHLRALMEGRTMVPRDYVPAVEDHLVTHLGHGGVYVPPRSRG